MPLYNLHYLYLYTYNSKSCEGLWNSTLWTITKQNKHPNGEQELNNEEQLRTTIQHVAF